MVESILAQKITSKPFGRFANGRVADIFELTNSNGIKIRILNYGGIIQSIIAPDRDGDFKDIVLGFDTLQEYVSDGTYHGALVGRFANRIAGGKFNLDGKDYQLIQNDGENCLHGGSVGLNRALWDAQIMKKKGLEVLRLRHTSPHGDQGFPGEVQVTADYSLSEENELLIQMSAITDQSTFVSLTMHPYFNLTGDSDQSILDHTLTLHADQFLPITKTMKPKGYFAEVEDTPFDFRQELGLGSKIFSGDEQLLLASGYDHCFVRKETGKIPTIFAELYEPCSGREVIVKSNAPGLQLYTGNFLNSTTQGKGNQNFSPLGGVCLEPQEFPNAPNEPSFGLKPLYPGKVYTHSIAFNFSTRSKND